MQRIGWFLVSLNLVFCAVARAEEPLATRDFAGLSYRELVELYDANGFSIYFSVSRLPRGLVQSSPPAGDPIERLSSLLEPFRLALAPRTDGWQVETLDRLPVMRTVNICNGAGQPLPDAVLLADDQLLVSDDLGQVEISAASQVERVSHPDYDRPLRLSTAFDACEYSLGSPTVIEELVVVSSKYSLRTSGSHSRIEHEDLGQVAELGGDAMRIISRLPGINTLGLSAEPNIRGGARDELLVLFNNVELVDPFHLKDFQSVFSGLNPAVVDEVEFYTGGFPARYGNKLSGVMDVKSNTTYDKFGGELGLSLFSTSLSVHDNFSSGAGNWIVAWRKGNLDWITQEVNPTIGEPSYYDAYFIGNYTTDSGNEYEVGWLTYADDVTLQRIEEMEGRSAKSSFTNHYFWIQQRASLTQKLDSRLLLSAASIVNKRSGFKSDPNPDEGVGTLNDDREFELIRAQQQFNYFHEDDSVTEFGLQVDWVQGKYNFLLDTQFGELAEILGEESTVIRQAQVEPDGWIGGTYVSHTRSLTESLTLEAGARWDYQSYYFSGTDSQLSPRVNLRYQWLEDVAFRLSWGRFHQPERINELQLERDEIEFQKAQYSNDFVVGIDWNPTSRLGIRFEGYTKRVSNPKARFENIFSELVLLPELSSDRKEILPKRVRARGLEASLSYDSTVFDGWISVSHASTEEYLPDAGWTPRAWDQETSLSTGFSWKQGPWQFSSAVLWHSGWKTTRLPNQFSLATTPLQLQRNRDELANFFTLDMRLARFWRLSRYEIEGFIEVSNATDRVNIGASEPELTINADTVRVLTEEEELFPIVPSIGFVIRLR